MDPTRKLSPRQIRSRIRDAGKRAKEEADARRKVRQGALPPEIGGQKGPEPTRYGDWEKKGLISDF